jgi:hypothetical protein
MRPTFGQPSPTFRGWIRLALLPALYRANPPAARVSVPTLPVYSGRPIDASGAHVRKTVRRPAVVNRKPRTRAVNEGHDVHWVDPAVAVWVAEHIRMRDGYRRPGGALMTPGVPCVC